MATSMPISFFAIAVLLAAIAFRISPAYRIIVLGPLFAFAVLSVQQTSNITTNADQASLFALFVTIWLSHITHVLCVEKYSLQKSSALEGLRHTYKIMFNARWINIKPTASRSHKTLDFSSSSKDSSAENEQTYHQEAVRSSFSPPLNHDCTRFLVRKLLYLLIIYVIEYGYTYCLKQHGRIFSPINLSDFSPEKQVYFRRLSQVTLRETILRIWITLHFLWSVWSTLTKAHHILALVFVGVGLDTPEEWPVLYGNPLEAYSMRRFWSKYWHRLVYRSYYSYGKILTSCLMGPRHFLYRPLINFLVFLFSGLVHAFVAWQLSEGGWRYDILFYCSNFAAIVIEDIVQQTVPHWITKSDMKWVVPLWKIFGFIWVAAFLFWSVPKYQYAKMACHVA